MKITGRFYVTYMDIGNAVFASQKWSSRAAAVIGQLFKVCPRVIFLKCLLELREVWVSKSLVSSLGDPSNSLIYTVMSF
jgi:hypothetical protein